MAEEQVYFADCESSRKLLFTNRMISISRRDRTCTFHSTWPYRSEIFETMWQSSSTKQCSWWLLPNLFILHIKVVRLKIFEESRLTKRFDKLFLLKKRKKEYKFQWFINLDTRFIASPCRRKKWSSRVVLSSRISSVIQYDSVVSMAFLKQKVIFLKLEMFIWESWQCW